MLVLVVLAMQPQFIAADTLEALLISRYPCYYPTGGTSSEAVGTKASAPDHYRFGAFSIGDARIELCDLVVAGLDLGPILPPLPPLPPFPSFLFLVPVLGPLVAGELG